MYSVFVLSKNLDFLESLPQAILNYNTGDLKFYFFSSSHQLNQQAKQSGPPDILLCDRDLPLGEGWGEKTVHKVYLSEKGDSEDEIYIYKNTELFLLEVLRRIAIWQIEKGSGVSSINKSKGNKLIWFLDSTESEWGKSCYNQWIEERYKTGQPTLCLDFSRMGILDRGNRLPATLNLSTMLHNWLYKRNPLLEDPDCDNHSTMGFTVVDGVKHPMDLELLKPDFVEYLLESMGASYGEVGLYSSICNETLTKCLLRYAEEIILLSDQPDVYEGPLLQMESWLKEINPRGQVTIFHTRSDPSRKLLLKKKILGNANEKGRRL